MKVAIVKVTITAAIFLVAVVSGRAEETSTCTPLSSMPLGFRLKPQGTHDSKVFRIPDTDKSEGTVMMNAVDEGRFMSAMKAPAHDDTSTGKFVMMYHGTLTRIYGLDLAVEAFAIAHQDMPGAELWILGSGPEQGPLADLAEQRGLSSKVKLVGQVASSEIPAWLSKCDVGILPIRRDVFLDFAFPNKLPEFVVMGKAVIISRLKAIRHYFSDASLAFFEPNDPTDLARQMVVLYRDPERRVRLAAAAAKEYAPIRWDLMKQRYLTLVDEITDPARRAAASTETLSRKVARL